MATQPTLFDIHELDRQSRRLDEGKAKINRALRSLYPRFCKIADGELALRREQKFHTSVHTERDGRYILMFTISRGYTEYGDGFNIIMYESEKFGNTVIASSKVPAAAEGLPVGHIEPCVAMFNPFIRRILEHFSPDDVSQPNLQASHKLARRVP